MGVMTWGIVLLVEHYSTKIQIFLVPPDPPYDVQYGTAVSCVTEIESECAMECISLIGLNGHEEPGLARFLVD